MERILMYNTNGIIDFLCKTHPELKKSQHYLCTEIRAIARDGSKKVSVLPIWNIASDELRIKKFFQNLADEDRPYCIYYSVGAFHFIKGKYKYTKMSGDSYLSTRILAVDFDGISEDEYKVYLSKIKDMGLKPISVSSGHGFQMIFNLERANAEPKILRKLCLRMQGSGFPVDMKACCTSQLMRLPYTYNCKEFDAELKNYYNPIDPKRPPVFIYEDSDEKYDCDKIINLFPEVDNEEEKLKKAAKKPRRNGTVNEKNIDRSFAVPENNGYRHYSDIISEEEYDALHTPIKAILTNCCEGYRNISLLYLTHYLESICGFEEKTAMNIINRWATVINYDGYYDVTDEYERMKKYSPNILNTKYDYEMAQKFGNLPKFVLLHKRNGNIILPNGFFSKYKNLSAKVVKTYFSILYFCNSKNTFSFDELFEYTGISKATLYRHIEELKNAEMLDTFGKNRYILVVPQDNKYKGYTVIPGKMLKKALFSSENTLSASELKVYIHLLHRLGQNSCFWDSQTTIGKSLDMSQSRISEITTELAKKGYIYKHCFKKKFTLAEKILTKNAKYIDENYHNFLKLCEKDASNENNAFVKYHCIYYKKAPEELIFFTSEKKMASAA